MDKVYYKGTDGIIIPDTRVCLYKPFVAPGWRDLRIGFFLSVTNVTNDDLITGLAETIAGATLTQDRYWIGVKNGGTFPRFVDTTFIGFTNSRPIDGATEPASDTRLSSSDIGIGTTNTNFWRPNNATSSAESAMIIDGSTVLAGSTTGVQQHFPQNVAGAGGYSTLLGMRLLRDTGSSLEVRCHLKQDTNNGDLLYSSTPTKPLMRDTLKTFPTGTQVLDSVVALSEVPTGFYFYWPFANSRLRIHAWGFLKYN